ncbi:hypothetical protein I5907_05975 [Panacibacter sp. DH6]|uniref:Uncharacterized protein n=1 Tax=Panacibacter microcysteis TaxID=2793269 RepID=A0A931E667_9BACT|nr:hypothetical protein [Panacibacter microcysteis]MBG9375773.1 hypothetical protein [Panacibacter microcysteis]
MKLKKVIALFCLLMLASQMLPVKEIGAVLFGNQLNEEIPHSLDIGKDVPCKLLLKGDSFLHQISDNDFLSGSIGEYVHFTSLLPHNHAAEIPTPPPNCA